jgi:hypothetical protein
MLDFKTVIACPRLSTGQALIPNIMIQPLYLIEKL